MSATRTQTVVPGTAPPDVAGVARALDNWMRQRQYRSWDPYDGLTAPLLAPLRHVPFLARLGLQAVKRSPWNLRPLLGIRTRLYTKTLSDLISAACVAPDASSDVDIRTWTEALLQRRLGAQPGACWGMDLPYASRFTVATPQTPNLFQTVNAMIALLDAWQRTGDDTYRGVAAEVVEFLEEGLGRLVDDGGRIVWRYYPGQDAIVYNVNALIGMALLRLAHANGDATLRETARATLHGVIAAQNANGSWWYAAGSSGHWVDGFHTGYVLEALLESEQYLEDSACSAALDRGMDFFRTQLLEPDGLPRYYHTEVYPIDVQNCAQAIQLLAKWSLYRDAAGLSAAQQTFVATCRELLVWEDGGAQARFRLQRGRWSSNELAAMRWGLAPMLLALRWLERAGMPPQRRDA